MKKQIKSLAVIGLSLILVSCSTSTSSTNSANSSSSSSISSLTPPPEPTYKVTWKNYDGAVLEIDENLAKGTTPSYDGVTPARDSDAQFTYIWTGWTPELKSVSGDAEYTATFEKETNKYTVTWKNEDGTVLKTEDLFYGETPKYEGDLPTKESTAEFNYTFDTWLPEIAPLTGNTTYVASFKSEVRKYTVTWKNEDGSVLKTEEVAYGTTPTYSGDTPLKESTAQLSYVFADWTPNVSSITGDVEYTATFNSEIRKYAVTWKNADGSVLEVDDNVPYGTIPTYDSSTPTRTDSRGAAQYTFTGWSPEITEVTGDQTYIAEYSAVGTFSFQPINYVMENGYRLSDINGAPWINSNMVGELSKIKKPSLNDDYYASTNYEAIKNWQNGPFDDCSAAVNSALNEIFNGDISNTTNGAVLRSALTYINDGSADQISEYFKDFDLATYMGSKDIFSTFSSLLSISVGDEGYEVSFNDGYLNERVTALPYVWIFDETAPSAKAVLTTLSNYFNLDFTDSDFNDIRNKEYDLLNSSYQATYAYKDEVSYYTVSNIPWAPMKSALLDLGLASDQLIVIKKYFRNTFNTVFNSMYGTSNGKNLLKKMITSRLAFDYRFLVGAEAYREVSRNFANMGEQFGNEKRLYTYGIADLCKEMVKKAFAFVYEQTYVELGSSEEIKNEVVEIIDEVLEGYMQLADNSWLADSTKQKMKTKLEKMKYISCYPDFYKKYEKIDNDGVAYQSIFDIYKLYLQAGNRTRLSYSFVEVDLFDYEHTYTVNAFYSPTDNAFVILNGLAAGFIGDSVEERYALLGSVIGHEITHAFDSSGSNFDENGRQKNWWSTTDKEVFNGKVNKLKLFYKQIALKKDLYVDGDKVNGEATADLGGMKVALMLAKKVNDFDYDKFFKTYSHLWLRHPLYSYEINSRSQDDPHPLNYLRVNVTVSQFDEFVETYNIKPGDGMYVPEEQRIKVW